MATTRTCKYEPCGKPLPVTAREDAKFCDELCRSRYKNERRKQSASDTRVSPVSGGVGSRGGNVRSVGEARQLQTASKPLDRWRLVMELQIHRTLLATGGFHVDALDELDLPPEAFAVRGTLVNSVRARGVMESTGEYRKVAHAAANARKAPIYRITQKGRQELTKLVGPGADQQREVGVHGPANPTASIQSGESQRGRDRQVRGTGSGRKATAADKPARLSDSPETLPLLPEPDPEAWAA